MRRSRNIIVTLIAVLGLGLALGGPPAAASPSAPTSSTPTSSTPTRPAGWGTPKPACAPTPGPHRMHCLALLATNADGQPRTFEPNAASDDPPGYGPTQLQSAYDLAAAAASRGGDQTVAIVDAYDAPTAEHDLAKYRAQYGLPECTTDNGCFRKVNQDGKPSPLPPPDAGWALEVSLDLDMVSAVCPRCHILLVEADDNQDLNLAASVATAANLGATQISNSYGEPEYPGERDLEPFFDQPGVPITVAAGDSGYGASYPATSATVTAVGGTSLWPDSGDRGWAETTWRGSGSGCSTQIRKPSWQRDSCSHRTANDLSAVADPYTPVAIVDTFGYGGWLQVGGTSASAPIIAGYYALVGDAASKAPGGSYPYTHAKNFFDITTGTDAGNGCSPTYLCNAGTGYDAPTGVGTPNYTGTNSGSTQCTSGWSEEPTPNLSQYAPNQHDELFGVAALSPSNVWTASWLYQNQPVGPVGSQGAMTDMQHWNGSTWQHVASANPLVPQSGEVNVTPEDMSFDRPDDGWAAGNYRPGPDAPRPLVEHWDGKRWSLSPVLTPPDTVQIGSQTQYPSLMSATGIAAVSPTDVWVTITVGGGNDDGAASPQHGSYLEHWDGRSWNFVDFPGQTPTVQLTDVHANSANDVWAVGVDGDQPVALHWDGRAWSDTAPPPGDGGGFWAVSGTASDDVWGTGTRQVDGGTIPLIEHFDGHAWTIVDTVDSDSIKSQKTSLWGVTAISRDDVWAAGVVNQLDYLLEHWDGRRWTIVPPPAQTVPIALRAISASGPQNVWAVGAKGIWTPFDGSVFNYAIHNGCAG